MTVSENLSKNLTKQLMELAKSVLFFRRIEHQMSDDYRGFFHVLSIGLPTAGNGRIRTDETETPTGLMNHP